MPFVLGQCRNPPDDCPCCDHNADAGRTEATIDLIRDMRLPYDWSLTEALENPLTQQWHEEHFLDMRASLRSLGETEQDNYPVRQAALAAAVLEHAPWSLPGRYGVAWGCIRVGLRYHGWVPTYSASCVEFLDPSPALFVERNGVLALASLICDAYELPDDSPQTLTGHDQVTT